MESTSSIAMDFFQHCRNANANLSLSIEALCNMNAGLCFSTGASIGSSDCIGKLFMPIRA